MDGFKKTTVDCSVVVPLYNERKTTEELYDRLKRTMDAAGLEYELVFVDDGSTDGTLEILRRLVAADRRVIVVELSRNHGQTPALAAGFDTASGRIIVSMDGDLQHEPEQIPEFLAGIEAGYDLVSGWRARRVDSLIMRKIPSRVANWLAGKISGVDIHDFGTTFKAYRSEALEGLRLFGEMHRFIPALLSDAGARITEIPIRNVLRPEGRSNYGISRTFKVVFDLLTLRFMLGYATRPLHFFGRAAACCIFVAGVVIAYICYDKFVYGVPIFVAHGPIAGLAGVLLLAGCIFIGTGLIGEMLSRVYFDVTGRKIYSVRRIHRSSGGE